MGEEFRRNVATWVDCIALFYWKLIWLAGNVRVGLYGVAV